MAVAHSALNDMSRVFHFEYWLRYYFIEERDNGLYLNLSAEQVKQMQAQFPDYWDVVERMLGLALSPELSQKAVVEFLQLNFEGKKYPANTVIKVLDSKEFSVEMYLFDTWVDLHEDQLMQKIYGFDYWMHIYDEWRQTEQAQHLIQSLKVQLQGESKAIN